MHWKSPNSPRQIQILSNDNGFFFDIRGIVHMDWVPEGQTVNQV